MNKFKNTTKNNSSFRTLHCNIVILFLRYQLQIFEERIEVIKPGKNQEQNTISVLPLNNLHKALVNIIRVRQSRKQQSIYIPRASYIDAESCLNLIISFPFANSSLPSFHPLHKSNKTLNLILF